LSVLTAAVSRGSSNSFPQSYPQAIRPEPLEFRGVGTLRQ
jgi:hypothetical protein